MPYPTVQEIADRLVALCRAGQAMQAYEELYDPHIVSREPEGFAGQRHARGMEAVFNKLGEVAATVAKVHGTTISEPLVARDHFALHWRTELTYKNEPDTPTTVNEIIVYRVANGKIVEEQFFYTPPLRTA